jgi:hypothetical protein
MSMTIREIFEQYVDLQEDVKAGDVTPAEALVEIATLQARADAINSGFTFTQSLDDLEALVEVTVVDVGNDSYGEELPEDESFESDDESSY